MVLLAPNLESSLGDLRFAIPSAVLLALVVMQRKYPAKPPITHLTFLGKIYLYSYIITFQIFTLFVSAARLCASAQQLGASKAKITSVHAYKSR